MEELLYITADIGARETDIFLTQICFDQNLK